MIHDTQRSQGQPPGFQERAQPSGVLCWLLPLVWLWLAACGSTRLAPWAGDPGPYDRFTPGQLAELGRARALLDQEQLPEALEALEQLLRQAPQNLAIASTLQDAELLALERGLGLPALERDRQLGGPGGDTGPLPRLRRWYAWRAERSGSAFELVLAARIEDDALAALRLLDRALKVDPQNLWVHYGRAHVLLKLNRLEEGRSSLDRALALDASQPRVRRLEIAVLSLGKDRAAATRALRTWLLETRADPRISRREWTDAALDLVGLELADERYGEALGLILGIETRTPEQSWRLEMFRAVALDSAGDYRGALEASRLAQRLRPAGFRAYAQEALLMQHRFKDLEAAIRAWDQAAELANEAGGGGLDGDAAALELQARVEAARLRERLALDRSADSTDSGTEGPRGP